jgi:hypothetical protein|tara:strand:- start:455 stop:829 length:375 start_codon:yes stop_codon:yes gene_type:complete
MPRPKRKEIKFTTDSALSLMQEIYNECVEQRSTAIRIQNKMIGFMKEAADMALIGPVLKEQQKIIDSSIDKKLQLSKLLSTVSQKNLESSQGNVVFDEDLKEQINSLFAQKDEDDNPSTLNYKM